MSNPIAVERGRHVRNEIRSAWLDLIQRFPFARHTAKSIGRHLPFTIARSTISWHMDAIRSETESSDDP